MLNPLLVKNVDAPPILDFFEKAKELSSKNGYHFDMTQAVPSYPTFSIIREKLAEDLKNDETSFYTDVPGLKCLRESIQKRHVLGDNFTSRQVIVTAGANHAMFTALQLFFKAGDDVCLVEPFYFNYDMAIKMMGINPKYFIASADMGFQLLADTMIEWLKENPVKGLILVTPNNPSGVVYSASEIKKLLDYTSQAGIEVIIDETYLRFDKEHLLSEGISQFIGSGLSLVGSFSKSHSLTGYRVGYLVSGPDEIEQALKVQDTLVICASHIGQRAAYHGLENCDEEVNQRCEEILVKTEMINAIKDELKHFEICSTGAYFAYLRHPFIGTKGSEAACKLFENTGILGLPGVIFGQQQGGCIRLAYCNLTNENLELALSELIKFDKTL